MVELQFENDLDEDQFTSKISSKHNQNMKQSTLALSHRIDERLFFF